MNENIKGYRAILRKTTMTAMFVALAVATKSITKIPLAAFGAGGMQISFGGIFTFFPAALFGPVYGGVASALTDILGYLIAPTDSYIPWLTVTAFIGGFVKGLIWRLVFHEMRNKIRISMLAFFLILGIIGGSFHVNLVNDGIISNGEIITTQQTVPTKGQIENKELSNASSFVVGLARYNNDTITLKSVNGSEEDYVALPSKINIDGHTFTVTKIASKALENCFGAVRVEILGNYKTIADDIFGELDASNITIVTVAGSSAEKFAQSKGIHVELIDSSEEREILSFSSVTDEGINNKNFSSEKFSFASSDTFRKYLSGYTNFAAAGLELVSLLGMLFIALNYLLARFGNKGVGNGTVSYLKIALATCVSGLLVTTINTFVLQLFLPQWEGRLFTVLLIPRVCEELIVCLAQSFVISILWGVLVSTPLCKYIEKSVPSKKDMR